MSEQHTQIILDRTGVARATGACDPHPAQDNEKWGETPRVAVMTFPEGRLGLHFIFQSCFSQKTTCVLSLGSARLGPVRTGQ